MTWEEIIDLADTAALSISEFNRAIDQLWISTHLSKTAIRKAATKGELEKLIEDSRERILEHIERCEQEQRQEAQDEEKRSQILKKITKEEAEFLGLLPE